MRFQMLLLASLLITPSSADSEPRSNGESSETEGDVGVEGFNSDKLAKELNSAMSDLPSFDSGLVSAVLKDMWSKAKKEGGFKASMWDLILEGAGIFSERDEETRKSKISKLVAAGRDLWSSATGDWSAEDYLDKLNWLAESGRERQAEKARKKEQATERESLKEVIDPISGLVEKLALGLGKGDLGAVDADSVKEQLIGALGSLGFQKKNKKQKAGDEL